MQANTSSRKKGDGSIANGSNSCPVCGAELRQYGRGTAGNARIDTECPNCGILSDTSNQRVVADGSGTAYDVLSRINHPAGHTDCLQDYLDDNLDTNDLTPKDVVESLKLALGRLCLEIAHAQKTEWIFLTESGFVSITQFDSPRDGWGPIDVDETAIQARLERGKDLNVRLVEQVAAEPPETALEAPEGVLA